MHARALHAQLSLRAGEPEEALAAFERAAEMARSGGELRAQRSALRGSALALARMGTEGGDESKVRQAVSLLTRCLAISLELEDYSQDATVYGDLGDLYMQLGDMDAASDAYDRCIQRMDL